MMVLLSWLLSLRYHHFVFGVSSHFIESFQIFLVSVLPQPVRDVIATNLSPPNETTFLVYIRLNLQIPMPISLKILNSRPNRNATVVTATSRIPPWLASKWGCRGRRLSRRRSYAPDADARYADCFVGASAISATPTIMRAGTSPRRCPRSLAFWNACTAIIAA